MEKKGRQAEKPYQALDGFQGKLRSRENDVMEALIQDNFS